MARHHPKDPKTRSMAFALIIEKDAYMVQQNEFVCVRALMSVRNLAGRAWFRHTQLLPQ